MRLKKCKKLILSFILSALIAVMALTGCNGNETNDTTSTSQALEEHQVIGEGEYYFLFQVTDDEENVSNWTVYTNAQTVGAALLELSLIAGEESEWGLMVTEVNGLTADWDANSAFWAFYVDGEFATAGVDATDIVIGALYAFVYTVS